MNFSAKWISSPVSEQKNEHESSLCPYFRRPFQLKSGVGRATVYITAKGIYKAYLNGREISRDRLTPGWTNYKKLIHYQVYDVTHLLQSGQNVVGAILSDGWYCGQVGFQGRCHFGEYPLQLFAELRVEYDDGTDERIVTDSSWQVTDGPIRYSDLLNGETVDNRIPFDRFFCPGFSGASFAGAQENGGDTSLLKKQMDEPVRVNLELDGTAVDPSAGLYDFGQNMAGVIRVRMKGTPGAAVQFRYGEMLDGGALYTENLRSAKATDLYICRGDGEEVFCPLFTFHGFRYMQAAVLSGAVEILEVKGLVLYSQLEETGSFRCSDDMVNRIFQNALWSQRGNFISVPTDCPQRDERLGWTGDAQIFCRSAIYNMDCARFHRNYMELMRLEQMEDGSIPDIVPYIDIVGSGASAWGDAAVIMPFEHYLMYGDPEIIRENMAMMRGWIDYLRDQSPGYIMNDRGYGDWLSIDDETDKRVMNTAYFANSARLMAILCEKIGDPGAARYRELFDKIKAAFRAAFVDESFRIYSDTQTAYLIAAAFGLLEPEKIREHLLRKIEEKNFHLSTGFIGVRFLLPVLTELGETALAYRLILNRTYPSWGYSVENGATTIWERWNSYNHETGFGDVAMNSFNHYSLGSCVEWMYGSVLGINADIDNPGFQKLVLKPRPDPLERIHSASGSYNSKRGKITVAWEAENGFVTLRLRKPAGMAVEFQLEGEILERVEDGNPVERFHDHAQDYEIRYRFTKVSIKSERMARLCENCG